MINFIKAYELHPGILHRGHITANGISARDEQILERRSMRMRHKLTRHVELIVTQINRLKQGVRKYQISGYHEYHVIENILKNNPDIRYKLVIDEEAERNKVSKILGSSHTTSFYDSDDDKLYFKHTKVPVMYIEIDKCRPDGAARSNAITLL